MFRLLLPRETKFFDLFEHQANLILEASLYLLQMSTSQRVNLFWHKFIKDLECRGHIVAEELYRKLQKTFLTPIDREDIYKLIWSLDNILDFIEKVVWKIVNYSLVGDEDITKFLNIIREAMFNVREGVFSLRRFDHERFERANEKMVECEDAADTLEREIIKQSYSIKTSEIIGKLPQEPFTQEDAQRVFDRRNYLGMKREVAEISEEAVGACRDAFNILSEILTKNV